MQPEYTFPLSPIQQGMLYHHLSSPDSGTDIEQMVATLREPFEAAAFRRAWERLVDCHAAFRTSFEWESRTHPEQRVHPRVSLPWVQDDLRGLAPDEQRRHLAEFLERDRTLGFDFRVAPLSRAALFQTGDTEWEFVWTFHHILADGQSYPSLVREAFARYDALREGREVTLPEPPPYRGFIEWLEAHLAANRSRAEAFWRETLSGFSVPTPLWGTASDEARESGRAERSVSLPAGATAALNDFAQTHRLTMNSLVQAAWALELAASSGTEDVVFGVTRACRRSAPAGADHVIGVLINTVPMRVCLEPERPLVDWLKMIRGRPVAVREFEHTPLVDVQRWSEVPSGTPLFESLLVFTPRLIGTALRELGGPWTHRDIRFLEQTNYPLTLFAYNESELLLKLAYDRGRFSATAIERCLARLRTFLEAMPTHAERPLAELPRLGDRERQMLLVDWNATQAEYPKDRCIHELFEDQARRTPDAVAVVFRDASITYRELNLRANQIARRLKSLGLGPGHFVGIFLKRSIDLVIALLGTLKAGAAYVPMDPSYPGERLRWMLEDTRASAVLTQRDLVDAMPSRAVEVVCIDAAGAYESGAQPARDVASGAGPRDIAYVIFTSGSSGRPKGVMVEHRNVTNFFCGMDRCLDFSQSGTWLAVTSISFDISVLELFWTLTRGFRVVLQEEADRVPVVGETVRVGFAKRMNFSLFYFAADAGEAGGNRYRLLLEGSRYADQNGFSAVWTPERHFHPFGGLYPNPSVTGAAIATITSRLQIRAGSVVLPLHDPLRIAEEWSVVDNLSGGRVGLSFASGWHANDFALMPQNYRERKEVMLRGIDTIRRLWRGEAVKSVSGTGEEIEVRIYPAPVQRDAPIWVTAAGNIETFRMAGRIGTNLLTNLLGQSVEELAEKIDAYRAARHEQGHPGPGTVSLMLHTFVGPDLEQVRQEVRKPFLDYLRTSTDLIKKARWECPAFATRPDSRIGPVDDSQLSEAEMQAIMDHAFERYFRSSGLFGTPEMCVQMVDRLRAVGVDEIACLIDFGVDTDSVLESLRYLNEVRERSNLGPAGDEYLIPTMIRRHAVTHLQCTPSLARMLASDPVSLAALGPLRKLLLGGEALPASLGAQLAPELAGDLVNMYGPTETTVWSTAAPIDRSGSPITIGRPIANTQVYIVDRHLCPTPIGVPGELLIGGDGVARGYLNRPDLTAERFIPDPFGAEPGGRLYRTGDLARYRSDGRIEFLGRIDHQVKIRGYRIELGEIESVLAEHPAVRECVVVARESGADDRELVAYVASGPAPASDARTVGHWRTVWEEAYTGTAAPQPADPTLNTSGWIDSYTGRMIPDAEMREWAEHAAGQILSLKPRRVLEIGCGTGMLLFRIAPRCEHYHGVDISAGAIRYIRVELTRRGLGKVTLQQAAADELSGFEPGSFDAVVLNSVIQYFPSAEYLLSVLERITPLVSRGGTIFLGDVRSLPINEAFHTSVELEQAPASMIAGELRRRIRSRMERDDELVLDPDLFRVLPQHLPAITRVSVHLKRGYDQNELTRFRYDVRLGVGGAVPDAVPPTIVSGDEIATSGIRECLASGAPAVIFEGIPNPRVVQAVRAAELLARGDCPGTSEEIWLRLAAAPVVGIDPEDLFALDVPYDVELTWSKRGLDRFDAIFRHHSAAALGVAGWVDSVIRRPSWGEYTNRRGSRAISPSLALELKERSGQRLPAYMVPGRIVLLEALPRTPNGKIDREALPEPDRDRPVTAATYVPPQSEIEKTIAAVLQQLLNVERVGTADNFFDLGANSLIMVQVNSHLRAALRRDLSLVDLFRYPTVNALAAHLGRNGEGPSDLRPSQERGLARVDALQKRRAAIKSVPDRGQVSSKS